MRLEVLRFLGLQIARRHRNVRHAVAKGLDAVAGTRARDRHGDAGIGLHEAFRHELHRRQNRRGAVNRHGIGSVDIAHHGKTSQSAENGSHLVRHFTSLTKTMNLKFGVPENSRSP